MKVQKLLAGLLAVTMAASMAACATGKTDGTAEPTKSTISTAEPKEKDLYGFEEPVTIKLGFIKNAADFEYAPGESLLENTWMTLYREHNIIPEVLYEVDASQAGVKCTNSIISGNYADILEVGSSDYVNFAQTDVIADITDVFEEYASDELKEYLNADGGLALKSLMIDGRLYGLPQMGNSYDNVPVMFIRQDWLDNLGLQVPTTMEELKKVAHAFTFDDPDKNGKNDTYGLAIDGVSVLTGNMGDLSGFFTGFGAYPGADAMAFVKGDDGKLTWGGTNAEGMKAGLQLLQDMYKEGSVAKDFITTDGSAVFEETGSGRAGIWFAPMWGAMQPASGAITSTLTAHMVSAPIPDGLNKGGSVGYLGSVLGSTYCVSSKCAHPEVLIKLMNLSVQKLCHPESNEEYYKYYGEPGVTTGFKCAITKTLLPLKNYDNYLKQTEALASGDTSKLNAEQLGDYKAMRKFLDTKEAEGFNLEDTKDPEFAMGCSLYTVFGDPQCSYAGLDSMIKANRFISNPYNALPTQNMADSAATLKKLTDETIVKIITGAEDVGYYDEFLKSWYLLGGQGIIDDAQAWADANA